MTSPAQACMAPCEKAWGPRRGVAAAPLAPFAVGSCDCGAPGCGRAPSAGLAKGNQNSSVCVQVSATSLAWHARSVASTASAGACGQRGLDPDPVSAGVGVLGLAAAPTREILPPPCRATGEDGPALALQDSWTGDATLPCVGDAARPGIGDAAARAEAPTHRTPTGASPGAPPARSPRCSVRFTAWGDCALELRPPPLGSMGLARSLGPPEAADLLPLGAGECAGDDGGGRGAVQDLMGALRPPQHSRQPRPFSNPFGSTRCGWCPGTRSGERKYE